MVYLIDQPVIHSVTLHPKELNFIFWLFLYYKSHANRHNSHYTYIYLARLCEKKSKSIHLRNFQHDEYFEPYFQDECISVILVSNQFENLNNFKTLRTLPHIYVYALVSILTTMLRISDTLNWFLTFFNSSSSISHLLTAVKMIQTRICNTMISIRW